ncbi:hypothetical protein GCM10027037_06370 [Mucilaginibacter koreensis]
MKYFTHPNSIVREIWGKADTILFIFAGAAAEFALNKAVDWLYFTGQLPADPLGRLFSTVEYARQIVFSTEEGAHVAIDRITAIHQGVEAARGAQIPDWAYRDVLFMLIDYSIRSYELLEHKLSDAEKTEVFDTFYKVGVRMDISGLPQTYPAWVTMREAHLQDNLYKSDFTVDLYQQYRKHLGFIRYWLLKQVQVLVVSQTVRQYLQLNGFPLLKPVIQLYRLSRLIKFDWLIKEAILPSAYKAQIRKLDVKA